MIEVSNLSFAFEKSRNILDNISFDIEQKHCIAILGNNGAGKTTLLKCISRIEKIKQGAVLVSGKSIFDLSRQQLAQQIAYVPQSSLTSHTMVFDAVLLGRKPYIKWDIAESDKKIVTDILQRFGLGNYASRYINELSGGEMQKVVLARAMAQQPKYLLLDEPTSNLDPRNQHEVLRYIREIAEEQNIGVAVVLHDLNLAMRYCDRFLFMKDTALYAYGGIETVTVETIEAVYNMPCEIIEHNDTKIIVPA